MVWFKKEETDMEAVPELPDLPDLPNIENYQANNQEVEVKQLPPIPGSQQIVSPQTPVRNYINEPTPDMQKSNYGDEYNNHNNDNVLEYRKIDDIPQPRYENAKPPQVKRMQEPPPRNIVRPQQVKKNEPVFVRLDNFESTIRGIQEIKGRLTEIEKLISKTKDIKDAEEKELEEWEREVQMIRTKMDEIDNNIFDKFN